jgi:hypothetical protein
MIEHERHALQQRQLAGSFRRPESRPTFTVAVQSRFGIFRPILSIVRVLNQVLHRFTLEISRRTVRVLSTRFEVRRSQATSNGEAVDGVA